MGNHPTTHYSQAKYEQRHWKGGVGGRQSQQGSALQTTGSHFSIGTGRNRNQYATTYNTITGRAPQNQYQKLKDEDIAAKRTHLMLGKAHNANFVTTNSKVYQSKANGHQEIDKNFVYNIKTNHFEYGDTRPQTFAQLKQHYTSSANLNYNNKGNAANLRSKLDESKKNDLRRNHFAIGGNSAFVIESTMSKQYRPASAMQRVDCKPALN